MKLYHNHCTNCKCVKCVKQFFRGTMQEVVMATLLTPSHWFLASIFKILLKHFYSFPPSPFSPTSHNMNDTTESEEHAKTSVCSHFRQKTEDTSSLYMLWGSCYHKHNKSASNKSCFFFFVPVEDIVCCWAVNVYWKTLDKNQLKRPGNLRGLWVYNLRYACRQILCQ